MGHKTHAVLFVGLSYVKLLLHWWRLCDNLGVTWKRVYFRNDHRRSINKQHLPLKNLSSIRTDRSEKTVQSEQTVS